MENRTAIIKQPDNISSFNDVYKLQKEYQINNEQLKLHLS